ncbi:MAG: (5-formylfuran-3-yl)methyl phosphate synthase [Gemmatimonadales bacterium]
MRLLVSVRSAVEVGEALAGGADIIDAKEPARGGLGAVEPDVLCAIADRVPASVPLSVALGDFTDRAHVLEQVARLPVGRPGNTDFLKLGFAGLSDESRLAGLIGAAAGTAARAGSVPSIIAVGYADWSRARAPTPEGVIRAAIDGGAAGVLLDTSGKDGRALLDWMSAAAVGRWIAEARRAGLLAAVAGSLGHAAIPALGRLQPDIVGVRGAACIGGRLGTVSAQRVRSLRQAIDSISPRQSRVPAKRESHAALPPSESIESATRLPNQPILPKA